MQPDYTEAVDGKVVLALFDHRLRGGSEAGRRGISVMYRSASFERSVVAIVDALLRYLVINPSFTTQAAYDFLRDKVELTVSLATDELMHQITLSPGDIEHLFGMDGLATDFVRFGKT